MKSITFNTAKEQKQAIRTGFNYTPQFDASDIVSINGRELTKSGLVITNKNVNIYVSATQSLFHFSAPFTLTIKN